MKITKNELKELNKKGKVELFMTDAHTGYWEILEVEG